MHTTIESPAAPHGRLGEPGARPAPRRVAALIDTYEVSGPGRQLVALAKALAQQGTELRIVMLHRAGRPRPPFAAYVEGAGVPLTVIPERGPFDLSLLRRVRELFDGWDPDVVQTHSYKMTVLMYLLRRTRQHRRPWIAFFHGATAEDLKVRLYTWLDNRLLGHADLAIVMSRKHARDFAHLGDRVRVLHNAVVALPASGGAVELPQGVRDAIAAGDPVVGVVGRLSPEKGVDVYLRAVALLEERGVRFVSVVAGDGPEREALHALNAALGLTHRVHFLGPVTAVRSLYEVLDLLVIPSRSEGLPNVLLEAIQADVPAVSTRVGAVPEVLEGTDAGRLVEPNDPAALADAIAAALHLKHDEASRRARADVAQRFSLERRTSEHLRMYGEVTAAAAARAAARGRAR